MRALILIFALAGCSAGPIVEFGQSLEEGASSVVYAVAEPTVPVQKVLRPPERPAGLELVTARKVAVTQDNPLSVAEQYLGFTETKNRSELREFLGVDPRQTEWCAAFVNSVLDSVGQPGSQTVSENPLMARSFTDWGVPVDHKEEEPKPGDVVLFPRGRQNWQGHVGFYVSTVVINDREYWQILGGNQNNAVQIDLFRPERAIAVRRAPEPIREARTLIDIIRNWFT